VRYQSIVKQLVAEAVERDEDLLRTHVDLLVAVIVDTEDFATPFPIDGTESDRRKWIEQLPFHVIGQLAPTVFRVGLVPFSVE
jgi:flagellar biosynthesis regulator FlaF